MIRSNGAAVQSTILGVALAGIYLANGRDIGTYDTEPATLIALSLIRGDGPFLDRFQVFMFEEDGQVAMVATTSRGHIVSRYPIATALLAVPLYLPQVAWLDRFRPGWDARPLVERSYAGRMGKNAAAIIAAIFGVALFQFLRSLGLDKSAFIATLAACLGSDMWTVASQALWQHGPAALALTLTMAALSAAETPSHRRFVLAGFFTGCMVAFRSLDIVLAAVILAWVVVHHRRRLAWFLPGPLLAGSALLWYNFRYFESALGGQTQLEALHPKLHAVAGPWSGNLIEGLLGTLVSPSRGLLIYCPWVALAVALLPWSIRRLAAGSLNKWLIWALLPYLFLLSKYAVWWGGHSFGPRYWTDVVPILAVVLALALEWAKDRADGLILFFQLAIVAAIVVQGIGAFCYPSSFNMSPNDIDRNHERLWDFRDCDLRRCLSEGPK